MITLNLFYEEPDPDRWFKFDRYPRRYIRRMIRGRSRPGGPQMVAINLIKGLEKIGVPYRINDYRYIKKNPTEIACIIGKPHLLFDKKWENPVILGAAIYSHPVDHPDLFNKYQQVKRLLVPGEWICNMFKPYYGDKVSAWPVGTDTTYWQPSDHAPKYDFLVYNKLPNSPYQSVLLKPILELLGKRKLSYQIVTYGSYDQQELKEKLSQCRGAIFLSRSETQGLAYQQILATDTPILAWDREGFWEDPEYYPHRVQYQPVSSVPYWDKRCGVKFSGPDDLEAQLDLFLKNIQDFKPREYILKNLTLEHCAQKYVQIYKEVVKELA